MKAFKLLVSFDGALSVVEREAFDVDAAMDLICGENPGRTALLVRIL